LEKERGGEGIAGKEKPTPHLKSYRSEHLAQARREGRCPSSLLEISKKKGRGLKEEKKQLLLWGGVNGTQEEGKRASSQR